MIRNICGKYGCCCSRNAIDIHAPITRLRSEYLRDVERHCLLVSFLELLEK